ncbi:unnamed protein product [Victoria cruziana]
MLSIFADMLDDTMVVFMDDFSIYGSSFDDCLQKLEKVLIRCEETNLVLSWEKSHFMVREGIVLGHIVSDRGIEVNKAKVETIVKLTPPSSVREVRSFLGHADHAALKYLMSKKDSKPKLIRWILLLQEFDLEIKDKKGSENVVADHLSKVLVEVERDQLPVSDTFPDEYLLGIMSATKLPWYAHYCNYLVTKEIPSHWSNDQRERFLSQVRYFHWDEPDLFKYCADQVFRRCVPEEEFQSIISFCHAKACGGHYSSRKTAAKVLQSGFYCQPSTRMLTFSVSIALCVNK